MDINELKNEVEARTGIPVSLLTGETSEEVIAKAKAILAFKKEHAAEAPQTPAQQFAKWMQATQGIGEADEAGQALADLEDSLRGYSYRIPDGGNPYINEKQIPDGRTPAQQFADFMSKQLSYDPFKNNDGWN